MKKVLTESTETRKEVEARKRKQLSDTFRTATFSELVKRTQPKVKLINFQVFNLVFIFQHDALQNKLNEIFKTLGANVSNNGEEEKKVGKPAYEQNFPELFFY